MKIMIGARRSGKTDKCIKEWLKDPAGTVLLCHSHAEATRIQKIAEVKLRMDGINTFQKFWPYISRNIVTYDYYVRSRPDAGLVDPFVIIDNLDMFVAAMTRSYHVKTTMGPIEGW
jgi:hypothetical protein